MKKEVYLYLILGLGGLYLLDRVLNKGLPIVGDAIEGVDTLIGSAVGWLLDVGTSGLPYSGWNDAFLNELVSEGYTAAAVFQRVLNDEIDYYEGWDILQEAYAPIFEAGSDWASLQEWCSIQLQTYSGYQAP